MKEDQTLKQATIEDDVQRALAEDIGAGDLTSALIPSAAVVRARILSREPMLCCGQPWVDTVFREIDPEVEVVWAVQEGAWLAEPQTLCRLYGRARSILTAERTALNFLQTLSATATQVHHYGQKIAGYHTRLLDTRKTIPGLRYAQKYAVACAGGVNHRMGLYDAFLIKENHILACGSITQAVQRARQCQANVMVEVEVETLAELEEALAAKPDRILLDNFSLSALKAAVERSRGHGCALEASGNVSLDSIADIAATGVDYVSVGRVTKSVQAIDLSLLVEKES